MNKTVSEAKELLKAIKESELNAEVEALVCVPAIDLTTAVDELKGSDVKVGAQNMHYEESGAFTGEISPAMLNDLGVGYVVLGHSERREYFHEDDEFINKKVLSAIKHGIDPILCVGETLEEREAGQEEAKVKGQVEKDLEGLDAADLERVVIAYEPIWAIGTGKTASSDDAEKMCAYIRKLVAEKFGPEAGEKVRIQYGGSVKPNNVVEIMGKENIDGALVGGASLEADSFAQLVNF